MNLGGGAMRPGWSCEQSDQLLNTEEEKEIHERKNELELLIKQEVKNHALVIDQKGKRLLSWKHHTQSSFDSSAFNSR